MRIAYIAAGAGALYCGACNRDVALFRALLATGHELCVVPLYTPLLIDDGATLATAPLFMGGISIYLAQAGFGHLPGAVRRMMDSPAVLRAVSRMAIRTDPRDLGPLTVSLLKGVEGPHAAEINRLRDFLRSEFRPDIVALSFSLLSSLAPVLRGALGVPVVCTLQGEEAFIDALPEPYRAEATALVRRHAASVDRFISCAAERVPALARLLQVEESRIAVVPTGIDVGAYAGSGGARNASPGGRQRIGYLSAIRPEKGLDVLVEALRELAKVHNVELAVAGQILDKAYWRNVRAAIRTGGLEGRVTYHGTLDWAAKAAFLKECTVFAFPTRLHESRAVAVLEALATSVPVVASGLGVVTELLAKTGGGLTVSADDPDALASAIAGLLDQPEAAAAMGRQGARAVAEHYSAETMARRTLEEYSHVLAKSGKANFEVATER